MTPREIAERSAGNLLPVPWIEASDVAEAVRFLVTDRARYMTGTEFVIDAGATDPLGARAISAAGRSSASACASPAHRLISSASPALRACAAHRRRHVVDLGVGDRRVAGARP